jgi:hypothetical protein
MERYKPDEWTRRGKKYKAQTFAALKQLYGNQNNDKDCQAETETEPNSNGRTRTDSLCDVVDETGLPSQR